MLNSHTYLQLPSSSLTTTPTTTTTTDDESSNEHPNICDVTLPSRDLTPPDCDVMHVALPEVEEDPLTTRSLPANLGKENTTTSNNANKPNNANKANATNLLTLPKPLGLAARREKTMVDLYGSRKGPRKRVPRVYPKGNKNFKPKINKNMNESPYAQMAAEIAARPTMKELARGRRKQFEAHAHMYG